MERDSKTILRRLRFPVSYVQLAERLAKAKGQNVDDLFRHRLRLTAGQISDPDALISYEQMWGVLDFAHESIAKDSQMELVLIEALPLTVHGYVGLAILSAETLEQAITQAIRWHTYTMPAYELYFEQTDRRARILFERTADFKDHNALFDELYVCAMLSLIALVADSYRDVSIGMRHSKLLLNHLPSKYTGLSVILESSNSAVDFPVPFLERTIPSANAQTLNRMQQTLEKQNSLQDGASSLTGRVRRIIKEKIKKGETISARDISHVLKMSARSMRRKLNEEQTAFKTIHHEARLELARSLLTTTDLSMAKISDLLGFSCEANFSKYFNQRTGRSPTTFRRSYDRST